MEKRFIVAIVLSVLVILIFQKLFPSPQKEKPIISPSKTVTQSVVKEEASPIDVQLPTRPLISAGIETVYETDKFILTFTNIGGALKGIKLKEYDTVLFQDQDTLYRTFALISNELGTDLNVAKYELKRDPGKLTYIHKTPQNIKVIKEYIFHKTSDFIELQISIENDSASSLNASYTIFGPSKIEQVTSMKGRNFVEMNADINGSLLRKRSIKGSQENIPGIVSWVALKNRYFTIAMKPSQATEGALLIQSDKRLTTGIIVKPRTIYSGSYIQDSYILFVGPLIKNRLAALDIGLESMISYGFFGGISVFLLSILGGINSIVHNWGVSIILVTFLINLILFPLTRKSFHSMQKMQELQPHMEKLRQLHKDNPQKLNKEMAELYRQYNVNPFGGCLPMLLQLPIFLAFYQALMRSIQLKGAGFLWIKDLSSQDALITFSNPVPLLGDSFNLLPILTVIVMFVQQQMSTLHSKGSATSEMAKQQKFMALFFPIFFGFILYSFPSGLVLYWLTNSTLMMAEQIMMRRHMRNA